MDEPTYPTQTTGALALESRLVRMPELVACDMDGELVMMSIERGEYYGVGGVGTRVWQLLEEPVSLGRIVHTVMQEFEVDEAACRQDMFSFADQLLSLGLVRLC